MKYATAFVASAILIWGSMFGGEATANEVNQGTSDFKRSGVEYRLDWWAEKVTTGRYGENSTKVSYRVYAGNKILHPRSLDGGTFIGCDARPPTRVDWWRIGEPQIGWLLILSNICARSRSFKSLIVVPYKTRYEFSSRYVTADFIVEDWPIVKIAVNGDVHIWSSYREWNGQTTAGSFFVPEFRVISRDIDGEYWVTCPPMPVDVAQWPRDLPNREFIGDFYAGLNRLEAGVMKSALGKYQEINPGRMRRHGLPDTRKGLEQLTKDVANVGRRLESLRSYLSDIWLKWANPNNRCR